MDYLYLVLGILFSAGAGWEAIGRFCTRGNLYEVFLLLCSCLLGPRCCYCCCCCGSMQIGGVWPFLYRSQNLNLVYLPIYYYCWRGPGDICIPFSSGGRLDIIDFVYGNNIYIVFRSYIPGISYLPPVQRKHEITVALRVCNGATVAW